MIATQREDVDHAERSTSMRDRLRITRHLPATCISRTVDLAVGNSIRLRNTSAVLVDGNARNSSSRGKRLKAHGGKKAQL